MDIGFLRDLVIVALGVAVMLVGISMALIGFSVYRSANAILKSGKATAAALEAMTTREKADETGKSLAQAVNLFGAVVYGARGISKIFKKGGK